MLASPFAATVKAAACTGGEIGRAQALQAQAAGLEPQVDFNPVLIKPETDRRAQVVVQGKVLESMDAADYVARRDARMDAVLASFQRLVDAYELVIVEGAGSPAEINSRAGGRVLGLCGGFQMLGAGIEDAEGVDGQTGHATGLGLLDVHTEMSGSKAVHPVEE